MDPVVKRKLESLSACVAMLSLTFVVGQQIVYARHKQQEQIQRLSIKDVKVALPGSRLVVGSSSSTVVVIEFADFECPPCRSQRKGIESIVRSMSDKASLYLQSFPLAMHPHAKDLTLISNSLNDQEFQDFSEKAYTLKGKGLDDLILAWQTRLGSSQKNWKYSSENRLSLTKRAGLLCGVTGTPTTLVVNLSTNQMWRCVGASALAKAIENQVH